MIKGLFPLALLVIMLLVFYSSDADMPAHNIYVEAVPGNRITHSKRTPVPTDWFSISIEEQTTILVQKDNPLSEGTTSNKTQEVISSSGESFTYAGTSYKIQDYVVFDGKRIDRVFYPYGSMTPAKKKSIEAAQWSYQDTVEVPIWTISGTSSTMKITAHKDVVKSLRTVFTELHGIKFPINPKETGAYSSRVDRGASYTHMNHPNGIAVDINWGDNPMTSNFLSWENSRSPYKVNAEVVNIFRKHGWYWGGTWKGTRDYMHFSINNN